MEDIWLQKKKTWRRGEKIKTISSDLSLQAFSFFSSSILLWGLFWNNFSAEVQGFLTDESYYFPNLFLLSGCRKEHSYFLTQKAPVTLPSLERFIVTLSNLCMRKLCWNWHFKNKAWWQEGQTWSLLFNPKPSVNPADNTEVQDYLQVSLLRVNT